MLQRAYGGNDYLDIFKMNRPYPMLDFILLILVAILVKYTFQSIGGFIRWIVFRKKSLKAYVKDDREGNLATFLLTVALVAVIVILVTV